jgi:hypothetical protein
MQAHAQQDYITKLLNHVSAYANNSVAAANGHRPPPIPLVPLAEFYGTRGDADQLFDFVQFGQQRTALGFKVVSEWLEYFVCHLTTFLNEFANSLIALPQANNNFAASCPYVPSG